MNDASIVCWKIEYNVLFSRPVTAIREGDKTLVQPQPAWTPLLSMPPHPEYPSGHMVTSGAAYQVLFSWLGTNNVNFSLGSEGLDPSVVRTYTNLLYVAQEVADSQVFGGVHFNIGGVHFSTFQEYMLLMLGQLLQGRS
ncbi:hypothetical protein CEUSTIGMA_g3894.t1 [Chlamydomonas eustigma]|uniref:Vanadium-dependent haloperoxidase NapH1-like second helical-bundle domain-containing protein n=1 Tax=Chlamydomonas eustigma TaxID=1157962 RepID=A0A250X0H9_9CHLO|nr:hypothetical protein CEUSTIGMA_g3894.t1 [Chlamydomonas eustigma]|eukprot:GAX76449.1 hypothetical protein CEUSTIGMA_g3894.t1 [Chlamydomonas eustigma]